MRQYSVAQTQDGSVTLVDPTTGEWMHSSQGAWGETDYVYGNAIRTVLQKSWAPQFLVVGFGAGFIEACIAQHFYRLKDQPLIYTFEKDERLVDRFFLQPYQVLDHLTCGNRARSIQLLDYLKALRSNGKWKLMGELKSQRLSFQVTAVLYDAYSDRTSPELWEDTQLQRVLDSCRSQAVFATYAARGRLTQFLKKQGFLAKKRPGFGRKRESTFAIRG